MLALTPRPRFLLLSEKGSFLKRDFDPLELTLRHTPLPAGASWLLEKEENYGELTLVTEGGATETRKVPSVGDWRDLYRNVRDAILGKALPLVTPQQALDVMVALELAVESSEKKGVALPWRSIQI
jgi:scyllo-inositol 2-dehydrogenase (NADP+)